MKYFNLTRYIVSLLLLASTTFFIHYPLVVLFVFMLLWLNNTLDDVVFYYGSAIGISDKKYNSGVACPVNGILTDVDKNVHLYHHIEKVDCLTKSVLVEKSYIGLCRSDALYSHITVFLNKFNKHVIGNIGSKLVSATSYDLNGTAYEMVKDGELIADNKGKYLTNTFVELVYTNGVHVILTMDKYISKAVPFNDLESGLEMFICRGSQCDIYIPSSMEMIDFREGEVVEIFDSLTKSKLYNYDFNYHFDYYYETAVKSLIKEHCNASIKQLVASNLLKSLSTFSLKNPIAIVLLILISLVNIPFMLNSFLFIVVYSFALERFIKNFMYSVMNIKGYSDWMATIYKTFNFLLRYHGK